MGEGDARRCSWKTFPFECHEGTEVAIEAVVSASDSASPCTTKTTAFQPRSDLCPVPSPSIRTVVVACHGKERNAMEIFEQVPDSLAKASDVLVVAPYLAHHTDRTRPDQGDQWLKWRRNEWGEGGAAFKPSSPSVSSFEVLDHLIHFYAQHSSVRKIILIGHSLGGQLVQRYSILGRGLDDVRAARPVPVLQYIVMNPSTYLHLSMDQPYKYGLQNRSRVLPQSYRHAHVDPAALYERLRGRSVHYMHGQQDTGVGDDRPEAMRQGANRIERSQCWREHLNALGWPPSHTFTLVADVGHNAGKMMSSIDFGKIVQAT